MVAQNQIFPPIGIRSETTVQQIKVGLNKQKFALNLFFTMINISKPHWTSFQKNNAQLYRHFHGFFRQSNIHHFPT